MKKFLMRIWDWVRSTYDRLIGASQKYVPLAIRIVEGIKKVVESPVDDVVAEILKAVIPGTGDDLAIDKARVMIEKWLPKVAIELRLIDAANNIEDPNEQLKAMIAELQKFDIKGQWAMWHEIAVMLIDMLADGEWSWADSKVMAEYIYQNMKKYGDI
jgi:hypothetical protein